MAWLCCHVLAFSALAPRDCCAAHAHTMAFMPVCHDAAAAASGPCVSPAGDACPMHDGAAPAAELRRLAGVCNAPAAALAAVLMQSGTTPRPVTLAAALATRAPAPTTSPERLVSQSLPPDSPPPRV